MFQHIFSAIQHDIMKKAPKILLLSVIANACPGRSEDQKNKIRELFLRYYDAFDSNDGEKGRTIIMRHKIDTANTKVIR